MSTVTNNRKSAIIYWLKKVTSIQEVELTPLYKDASNRVYYRVPGANLVVMDSPPALEDNQTFIKTAQLFANLQIMVPKIIAYDLDQGFLLLSDLGDQLLFKILNSQNANHLYTKTFSILVKIQQGQNSTLPKYDHSMLRRELNIFKMWYLENYLQKNISTKMLTEIFEILETSALEQPRVLVHRDFHSRNLILKDNAIAVLDFQGAVLGPITYDLVSLLRDCYIDWPKSQVNSWLEQYYIKAKNEKIIKNVSLEQYERWFDLIGLQRHLKALGIFARLYLQHHNDNYLPAMPRTYDYILDVCEKYPELRAFEQFLSKKELT